MTEVVKLLLWVVALVIIVSLVLKLFGAALKLIFILAAIAVVVAVLFIALGIVGGKGRRG
jgi:hypothetical protein